MPAGPRNLDAAFEADAHAADRPTQAAGGLTEADDPVPQESRRDAFSGPGGDLAAVEGHQHGAHADRSMNMLTWLNRAGEKSAMSKSVRPVCISSAISAP